MKRQAQIALLVMSALWVAVSLSAQPNPHRFTMLLSNDD